MKNSVVITANAALYEEGGGAAVEVSVDGIRSALVVVPNRLLLARPHQKAHDIAEDHVRSRPSTCLAVKNRYSSLPTPFSVHETARNWTASKSL
ncbi:MAG: hypothetical protein LAP85_00920 [Acidobacteriia bacterium]|nr:hypothetical protein [Terriglobia bacterium]